MDLKNNRRGRIKDYTDKYKKAIFSATDRKLDHNWLWNIKADCAFPAPLKMRSTQKTRPISSRTA